MSMYCCRCLHVIEPGSISLSANVTPVVPFTPPSLALTHLCDQSITALHPFASYHGQSEKHIQRRLETRLFFLLFSFQWGEEIDNHWPRGPLETQRCQRSRDRSRCRIAKTPRSCTQPPISTSEFFERSRKFCAAAEAYCVLWEWKHEFRAGFNRRWKWFCNFNGSCEKK